MLYAVPTGIPGRLKHGMTTNLDRRLTDYRGLYPEAEYVWTRPGDIDTEDAILAELAAYNVPHVSGRPSEVFEFGDIELGVRLLDEAYAKVTGLKQAA
jgi:hypothetical protein